LGRKGRSSLVNKEELLFPLGKVLQETNVKSKGKTKRGQKGKGNPRNEKKGKKRGTFFVGRRARKAAKK